jgi:hypothetical protein
MRFSIQQCCTVTAAAAACAHASSSSAHGRGAALTTPAPRFCFSSPLNSLLQLQLLLQWFNPYLQDKHTNMLIYWRPDVGKYRVVITEEVKPNTPFDPPFFSEELTPIGGFVKPGNDSSQKNVGRLMAALHLNLPGVPSEVLCQGFGNTVMNPNEFGWTLGFRQGADGVPVPVISDNATGLTNKLQVRSSSNSGNSSSDGSHI